MKTLSTLCTFIALTAAALLATEARVESMGSNSDFIHDDVSVFENPATAFDFGNLLVGALGRISRDADGQWSRSDEWYGGWVVYPLSEGKKVLLGATLNRATDIIQQYRKLDSDDFFTVFGTQIDPANLLGRASTNRYSDFLDAVQVRGPYGNVYAFGGLSINDELSFALGGRYAGYGRDEGPRSSTNLSLAGANLGITYKIDRHSLEASVNYGRFSLERKETAPYNLDLSSLDNSFNVLLRGFIKVNEKNTFVPILSLDKISLLGINNTDLGFGGGFNRDLHQGFVWAGARYAYHTAEYPERIGGNLIYPKYADTSAASTTLNADMDETSHKLMFSFGVEKKMLWDWFHLRVGGNKVFEYLSKKKASLDYTSEEGLYERDVDAVAWGIALGTPDDRLLFDITVSEEFPYSNILAGGEDGIMLSRISAALKF